MKIGIGTTIMSRGMRSSGIDGIGHYTNNLLIEYIKKNVDFIQTNFSEIYFKDVKGVQSVINLNKYHLLASKFNFETNTMINYKKNINLFHATDYYIPTFKHCPVISTVMDTIPISHPEWTSNGLLNSIKIKLWKAAIEKADHIITISNFSKQQILRHINTSEKKISVIPLGVTESYFDNSNLVDMRSIYEKYSIPKTYFLSVGTIQPRKNIENLIAAHLLLPEEYRKSFPLVLVGRYGWGCRKLLKDLELNKYKNVLWVRYVPEDFLRELMRNCNALLVASLYEGFGLPVLEGFASKVPVISSNITSLPEVGSFYSLQINPRSSNEISCAMRDAIDNRSNYDTVIKKAFTYAKTFSWKLTAEKTLKVYDSLI